MLRVPRQIRHGLAAVLALGLLSNLTPPTALAQQAADSAAASTASAGDSDSASASASGDPSPSAKTGDKIHMPSLSELGGQDMVAIGKELFALFVVVTLLESALAALFQWRAYRLLLNARAMKTPILFVVGLFTVIGLAYDPFVRVLLAAKVIEKPSLGPTFFTALVSALILAGGSAGVNGLFRAFGIRNDLAEPPTRPAAGKAWLSVTVQPSAANARARFEVFVAPMGPAGPNPPPDNASLAGVVSRATPVQRLGAFFLPNPLRFPNNGGTEVDPGTLYRIWVAVEGAPSSKKLIYEGTFAPGAIVDLVADV